MIRNDNAPVQGASSVHTLRDGSEHTQSIAPHPAPLTTPVTICGDLFITKTQLRDTIRERIATAPIGRPLTGQLSEFLCGVLQFHRRWPQKVGCGIRHLEIRRNRGKALGIWIVRMDGTEADISWVKVLSRPSARQDVLAAARDEIRYQSDRVLCDFFAESGRFCPVLGHEITQDDVHVHHAGVPFHKIVTNWLAREGLDYGDVITTDCEDGQYSRFADPDLAGRWRQYHQYHANLQVVSKIANLGVLTKIQRTGGAV